MDMDLGILKELGTMGVVAILFIKQYQAKDNSQNKQNDELVNHLMESNKQKDEMLKETVQDFKGFLTTLMEKLEKIDGKIK
ncbi:MAG: hypothetical protein ACRC6A_09125 [Fusobacteriaceae bacterium]